MFSERTLLFCLGLGALFVVSVKSGGMPPKLKCLDQDIDLGSCFKGFKECAKTMMSEEDIKTFTDPNSTPEQKKEIGMKAHKNMCIRVCQWTKQLHFLNEDKTLNITALNAHVDEKFPEAARADLKSGMTKCHEDNSKAFSDENQCASYEPFEKCMKETYMKVCKIDASAFHMDSMGQH